MSQPTHCDICGGDDYSAKVESQQLGSDNLWNTDEVGMYHLACLNDLLIPGTDAKLRMGETVLFRLVPPGIGFEYGEPHAAYKQFVASQFAKPDTD